MGRIIKYQQREMKDIDDRDYTYFQNPLYFKEGAYKLKLNEAEKRLK